MRNSSDFTNQPIYHHVPLIRGADMNMEISYDMAFQQSDGFFDDIPNDEWKLIRENVERRINHCTDIRNGCFENPNEELHIPLAW